MTINDIWPSLKDIEDKKLINTIHNMISPFVSLEDDLNLNVIQQKGWIAVPVPFAITENDASHIAKNINLLGINVCYATWFKQKQSHEVFAVPMTKEGLIALGGASIYSTFMMPLSGSFCIYTDNDLDYYILSGTKDIVYSCLNHSINEIIEMFEEEATKENKVRERIIRNIMNRYSVYLNTQM